VPPPCCFFHAPTAHVLRTTPLRVQQPSPISPLPVIDDVGCMTTALLPHEYLSSGLVVLGSAPELPDTIFTGVSTWLSMRGGPLLWKPSVHGNYLIAANYRCSSSLHFPFVSRHSAAGLRLYSRNMLALSESNHGATRICSAKYSSLRFPDLCPHENLVSCTCRSFALSSNHFRQTG
jgi:hypothetical protein